MLHCKSLPNESDRSFSSSKTRKIFPEGSIEEILLKTSKKFRVSNATNSKLRIGKAKKPVAYVCRGLTNASVFGDRAAVVSNQ
jgi:hypothetical protein